jgi:hypothetical protein
VQASQTWSRCSHCQRKNLLTMMTAAAAEAEASAQNPKKT